MIPYRRFALLALLATQVAQAQPAPKPPEGIWLGTLEAGGLKMRMAFRIKRDGQGALSSTMASLDQSSEEVPVDKTTYVAPVVHLDLAKFGISFEGKLQGDSIVGALTQGKAMPLTLKRVDKIDAPKRPQEPKRPFPYREEEVTISVPAFPLLPADAKAKPITLAGTLTLPRGKGPFPAVVFVTGSGAQDRDENIFDHKPFLVLSDSFARAGFATLRFDDRGTGKSEGSLKGLTTLDFVEDTLREVEYLSSRPEIDKRVIAILGHSEGAVIAPIVATRSKAIRLVVMLAGTGMTGDKILVDQNELTDRAAGVPAARLAQDRRDFTAFYAAVRAADTDAAYDAAASTLIAADPAHAEDRKQIVEMVRTPWFRTFLSLDPVPYLQRVRVPVLAIAGEKDLQVPPENIPLIEAALRRGKNPDATAKLLPGLNHLFQHATSGSPSEYGAIEETFAPEALKLVTDWLVERAHRARH